MIDWTWSNNSYSWDKVNVLINKYIILSWIINKPKLIKGDEFIKKES